MHKTPVVVALLGLALALTIFAAAPSSEAVAPRADGKACLRGAVHAIIAGRHRCLKRGQPCARRHDRQYHRYGFHCHTGGRLSRSSAGGNETGSGCQAGYSPCLPRVADLNCADIPASKKPVRVTGPDPYRLDGDGDGIACE